MKKTRFRVINGLLWFSLSLLSFYKPTIVSAETYTADSSNRDFYFVSSEEVQMSLRTYAWQYNIDSMLWVYDEQNNLITANDDYFGLDSFVQFTMLPDATYRVRAGVCCGDPERWYGTSYDIEPSITPINAPETTTTTELTTTTTELTTTTTSTTTTVPETTTTVPETTTTWPTTTTTVLTPTVTVTTTTEPPQTTTTVVETTTSTSPQTTTTVLPSTTVVSTTIPAPATSTTTTTLPPTTTTSSTSTTTTVVADTTTTTTTPTTTTIPETNVTNLSPIALAGAVLDELTTSSSDQLEVFFEELNIEDLSPEQQDAVIEALSNAPDDVKETFESTVNVFGGGFDDYTPLGSTVTVGERKVIVAATGVLFMAPTVAVSSSTSGSQSSDSRRRR